MPLRAVIVGAGIMGRWHARAAARAGARVVAVVDTDRVAAGRLAARIASTPRVLDDLSQCLDDCEVVHVCTPAATHTEVIHAALEAGRHVLAEKPLAPSLDETEGILDAARRAGVIVNPVHQFPFQRGVRNLLERQDELGDLVRVVYRTSSAGGIGRSDAGRAALLREILPHPASLFHRFVPGFDPLELDVHVQADDLVACGRHGTTYLDAFITLRGRPPCNELQITGTRASALADLFHGYSILDRVPTTGPGKAVRPFAFGTRVFAGAAANGLRRVARAEPAYPGLRELVQAFYAAVLDRGSPPPVSASEILAAAQLEAAVPRAAPA